MSKVEIENSLMRFGMIDILHSDRVGWTELTTSFDAHSVNDFRFDSSSLTSYSVLSCRILLWAVFAQFCVISAPKVQRNISHADV